MAYGQVNADVIGTSVAGSNLGAGNASIMKNRIINGAMVIDQRNAGASVTTSSSTNTYTVDRWRAFYSATSKYTIQQNAGSVTPPTGFTNYIGITSSAATSVGSTDYYNLQQRIEGFNIADLAWGTANAKTVTLSFQVYSSLTGTFSGCIQNNAGNRSYPFTYTISSANTWTQITVTLAGDTTGTWLTTNGIGIIVQFNLGMGSTFNGTANAWQAGDYESVSGSVSVVGTNGATWYMTGVQLEVGSSATGYEYVNYQTSLANCQRYFEMSFTQGTAPAQGVQNILRTTSAIINTTTAYANSLPFSVVKRTTPTMTIYRSDNGSSNGQPAYFSAGAWNNGSGVSPTAGTAGHFINFGGTFALLGAYHTDYQWTASAEL